MTEKNNQEISNANNSLIQQANGDINNYGLGYNDVKDICHDVVRQELSIVTKEAVDVFHREIRNFEDRFVERLEKLETPQITGKLATPKLQFILHDTIKEYAKSDIIDTKEELVDLMIERLKVDDPSTEQHLIDESIKTIPNLSLPQSYFLGALTLRKLIKRGPISSINNILKNRAVLYKYLNNISGLDIHYLKLVNCCADIPMTRYYIPLLDNMKEDYDLLFRHSITEDAFNAFLLNHTDLSTALKSPIIIKNAKKNEIRPAISSVRYIKQTRLVNEDILPEIEQLFNLFTPFSKEEIKEYLVSLHPDWQKAIDNIDREEITHIDLTPVGTYIGRRIVKKTINEDILSLKEFYK